MLQPLETTIRGVIDLSWPMIFICLVAVVSLRIVYIIKNRPNIELYKELSTLAFVIYILCLFQVVTFQDTVTFGTNNFIPFVEMFRYNFGTRLFFKNVVGNVLMFIPYGFFASYYLKPKKFPLTLFLVTLLSLSIEITQLMIGRVFDVDDIMLNIIGGMLGYGVYLSLDFIGRSGPKFLSSKWFLNILSLVILIVFVLYVYHLVA